MTEGEEDRFLCLACQARHFPAIFRSRRALRIIYYRDLTYTLYIPCICMVYTILSNLYFWHCTLQGKLWKLEELEKHAHSMVAQDNNSNVHNMVCIYIVKHFWVCSLPFWVCSLGLFLTGLFLKHFWVCSLYNLNIKRIFMEYQRYII